MKKALLCLSVAFACGGDSTGDDGGDPSTRACLPADAFTAIERHVLDLVDTAALLADHASPGEVTGFFLAPALPTPPALPASFATLVMPCTEAIEYEPFCEEGRCSQISCTGEGTEWLHHLWLEEPIDANGWSIENVVVLIEWSEELNTTFSIRTTATSPDGSDASMMANGRMDADGSLDLVALFPELHRAGAVLEYSHGALEDMGRITIDEVVVAEVDASTGRLVPTDECP